MILTINNLTGSTKYYLSNTINVAGNSFTNITNQTQQIALSYDGQLKSDLSNGLVQLYDGVNTYGNNDAIAYLQNILNFVGTTSTPVILKPGTQDVFGTLITAPRELQIDIQFFNGILNSLVNLSTSGTGSGSMGSGNALFSTGTGTTSQCSGVSSETVAYSSGCEIFAHFTAAFTVPTSANSYQRIGIYNSLNGFYVGFNGTTFGIAVRNNGSDTFISQSSWNQDSLSAASDSLFTRNGVSEAINLTYANVWRIRYGWLGSAPIYFEVMSPDGSWITFHQVLQPNTSTSPSVQNPNLPITVDVSKTSADSTNIIVYTACWGAGVTFATNVLQDPQTYEYINVDKRNELRTATSTMLIGAVETGSILDQNMWSATESGSGSYVIGNGLNTLSTGTTSNSSVMIQSQFRARFIPGTINAFYAGIRLGDTGVSNNVRRWGAYETENGVFFQLNGTTIGIGIRQNGSDTIITNFNGPHTFTLDINFHTYEIQYSSGSVYFYQNGNLIHTYNSSTSAVSSTPHYHLTFESTNSGGGTSNAVLYVRGSSILRYGEAYSRPRYFHPFYTSRVQTVAGANSSNTTTLTTTITATKVGSLIVVTATSNAGTLTCTDSASQTYSTAVTINSGGGTPEYLYIFYIANSVAGVTSVTITDVGSHALNMIVTEYANIITSSPLDQTSSASTTLSPIVTSWTSGTTSATIQANELLVGSAFDISHNNTTLTPGTGGWNTVNTVSNGAGGGGVAFQEDQYVISTGTYAATGGASSNDTILAAIATFKVLVPSLSTGFTVPNTPTVITIGAGTLRKIIVNTLGTGSANVTFYDNTTNSGNPISVLSLTSSIGGFEYDLDFSTGLTMVVNSITADFTVIYD